MLLSHLIGLLSAGAALLAAWNAFQNGRALRKVHREVNGTNGQLTARIHQLEHTIDSNDLPIPPQLTRHGSQETRPGEAGAQALAAATSAQATATAAETAAAAAKTGA